MQSFFKQTTKTDQTARMHRLIGVFVGCSCEKVSFLIFIYGPNVFKKLF